jgi:PAS domain S-box-containing protein
VETHLEAARRDLAILKVAEDDAREFAQSIIDTIREPLVALDQDLRIVAVSRAFYDVFHVSADQTLGQVIFDLGNGQWDIPRLRELLDTILLQATTFNDYEVVHDFSTIGRRTMLLNARQVKRSLGKEKILLLAIEDVTERRRMEAELQKNQRVESLGILAGGIAHDFNNLMAGLMANTELARVHLLAGEIADALVRIEKTPAIFARGRALTRRLLTFSKGGTPTRATTALGPLVKEWVDFALMGSDVTASLEIDPGLWPCDCDVGQVSQVMNNLLINARQASPEGGVIAVHASNLFKLSPFVCLEIRNGGPAIPPEFLGRIFDPFFTTKAEGSGLGLAIAFSIVRQHGGWIDVASDPQNGTALSVFLPASTGKPLSERGAAPPGTSVPRASPS